MTTLAEYLLKANLCLAGFYALYYGLLRRHTFFGLNRTYLLTALAASFVLPLISLPEPVVATVSLPVLISLPVNAVMAQPTGPTLEEVLLAIYGMGAGVFLSLLLVSLWRLGRLIRSGEAHRQSVHTLVLLADEEVSPFSFFRYLVLNQTDFAQHSDPIIRHELAHIRQWHSVDVLLAELVKVVCWPNPVAWLYKRSLQQVHEYLADQQAADKAQYARFLFDYAFQTEPNPVTNSFFAPAMLTQRIRMLYQARNTSRVLWKYALAVPLLAILVGLTAAREPMTRLMQVNQQISDLGVDGFVSGPNRKPLYGAHVIILNTNRGAETDGKGYFKLTDVPSTASLVISFVGCKSVQIPIKGRHGTFVIALTAETTKLPETIVVESPKPVQPAEATRPVSATMPPNEVFTVVEQSPEFPGGMVALGQYLGANLHYPDAAREQRKEGTVFVSFVVSDEGRIADVMILKGVGYGCDGESIRLVQQMPRWTPGRQSGRPVSVKFNLPIRFSLAGNSGKTAPIDTRALSKDRPFTMQYNAPLQLPLSDIRSNVIRLNNGAKPVILIDGKEQSADYDLDSINPMEIESVSVTKSPSVQSTYGDRGKNGVIMITTKAKKP